MQLIFIRQTPIPKTTNAILGNGKIELKYNIHRHSAVHSQNQSINNEHFCREIRL